MKADYKARLSKIEAHQDDTGRKISDGFEMRPVDALVTFHDPQQNRKTYRREDTGETIREESMNHFDYEQPLFKNANGKDATDPGDEHAEIEQEPGDEPTAEDISAAEGAPIGTSVGTALDQAASVSEAPLLDLDLLKYDDESGIVAHFKRAAKKAGWSEAQVSMLKTQIQAVDTVSRMKEVLKPHCQ